MSGWARSALWAFGLFVVVMPAYWIGADRFNTSCSSGGCDMAGVAGLGWAMYAALVYVGFTCCIALVGAVWRAKRPAGSPPPRQEKDSHSIWP